MCRSALQPIVFVWIQEDAEKHKDGRRNKKMQNAENPKQSAAKHEALRASYIDIHGSGNYIQRAALQRREVRHVEFNVPVPVDVMIDGEIATLECCSLDIIPAAVDIYI